MVNQNALPRKAANEIVASIIRMPRREYGPTAMAPNNVSPATAIPSNRMML